MFCVGDAKYPATFVSLPCIVETHKTLDDSLMYKSGEIGQMLIVHDPDGPPPPPPQSVSEVYPSGLTPPTTNIVSRRFANAMKPRRTFPVRLLCSAAACCW